MIIESQTEMNPPALADGDSIWPLKNKLYTNEM